MNAWSVILAIVIGLIVAICVRFLGGNVLTQLGAFGVASAGVLLYLHPAILKRGAAILKGGAKDAVRCRDLEDGDKECELVQSGYGKARHNNWQGRAAECSDLDSSYGADPRCAYTVGCRVHDLGGDWGSQCEDIPRPVSPVQTNLVLQMKKGSSLHHVLRPALAVAQGRPSAGVAPVIPAVLQQSAAAATGSGQQPTVQRAVGDGLEDWRGDHDVEFSSGYEPREDDVAPDPGSVPILKGGAFIPIATIPDRARVRRSPIRDDETMSMLTDIFDKLEPSLPPATIRALVDYSAEGYKMSGALTTDFEFRATYSDMQHYIVDIDRAFQHVTPVSQPFVVFRGMRTRGIDVQRFENRVGIEEESYQRPCSNSLGKAFVSTTLSPRTAMAFIGREECCLIKILVRRGTRVIPMWPLSEAPDEKEVLLDRRQTFRHTGIDMIRDDRGRMMSVYKFVTC